MKNPFVFLLISVLINTCIGFTYNYNIHRTLHFTTCSRHCAAVASLPVDSDEQYNDNLQQGQSSSSSTTTTSPLPPTPVSSTPVAISSYRRARAVEISQVVFGQFLKPVISSLLRNGRPNDWNTFWTQTNGSGTLTNAQRLALAIQELGPTYVKFAQALSSRPDIVPRSLADALSVLQDDMEPFDSGTAREIIRSELSNAFEATPNQLDEFLQSLSETPVAAASVGQVYSGSLPGYGKVAVKVQRPGIREIVERDAQLLRTVAAWIESIPAFNFPHSNSNQNNNYSKTNIAKRRLVETELLNSVDEFMSRLFEELDYRNEASNMEKFASLYSVRRGSSKQVKVVVPEVLIDLCTDNVIVMEWIEGTKLTNVVNENGDLMSKAADHEVVAENLSLVKLCIDCTLSQLLDTGVLHADPHGGNLLKVKIPKDYHMDPYVVKTSRCRSRLRQKLSKFRRKIFKPSKKRLPQLGYLDFGMLSTVDSSVRDALVCAVTLLVFASDVTRVANLFGELQLLPDEIVNNKNEMQQLKEALDKLFKDVLVYPEAELSSKGSSTHIPSLRFDKLLDGLSRLIPRFRFDLPPYFLNNARALSTLEGIARSLNPSFNVLQVMYPYSMHRLIRNPTRSIVVDNTIQCLIRSEETGRIELHKVRKLLDDAALMTGYSKRKVLFDILKTRGGLRLTRMIATETIFPRRQTRRHTSKSQSNSRSGL